MSTATPTPDPGPEDISRALAEIERHLIDPPPADPTDMPDAPIAPVDLDDGQTRRVRQLRAEVAEARALAALQDDDTPLLLDTAKVRKRRKKAHEAARLHLLGQDPAMRAWQAARMRRLLVTGAMLALTLALAWSTAGVQHFAAEGAPTWSPGWIFAWLVEPFMSIALLVVVGARAYLGTQGQPLNDPKLIRIEYLFLGLTLGMNAWPYLPWTADKFSVSTLVLHILGPIVAVASVTALPIILAAFAHLDYGDKDRVTPLTVVAYSANATSHQDHRNPFGGARHGVSESTHRQRLHALITAEQLPAHPSARAIQRALGCATETASRLRDELAGEA
ncbi:hypothetical protein [Nonomuraea sp. NPDC049141]|uniref:hypothetical protein n=1 Tax=Nonomuraea sp. NPDC049141 TaxID=3155500 RepID=UPI0033E71C60